MKPVQMKPVIFALAIKPNLTDDPVTSKDDVIIVDSMNSVSV